jgi:hypothetical protein
MKSFIDSTSKDEVQKYIILQNGPITLDGLYDQLSQPLGLSGPLLNFGYPTGYPWARENTRTHTWLGSDRVRAPPMGKKLYLCPSLSDRVPSTHTRIVISTAPHVLHYRNEINLLTHLIVTFL